MPPLIINIRINNQNMNLKNGESEKKKFLTFSKSGNVGSDSLKIKSFLSPLNLMPDKDKMCCNSNFSLHLFHLAQLTTVPPP
jgi:hypothetical protein